MHRTASLISSALLIIILLFSGCSTKRKVAEAASVTTTPEIPVPKGEQINSLDNSQPPAYGEISLDASFDAEPHKVSVTSGGEVNVLLFKDDCTGYVSVAPDAMLNWSGNTSRLAFFFEPNTRGKDATMAINLPNGMILCNDDAFDGTTDPIIIVDNPLRGEYFIRVGSYNENEYHEGTLYIIKADNMEINEIHDRFKNPGQEVDYTQPPAYGEITLNETFGREPHIIEITTGGPVNLNYLGNACMGYVSVAPDFRINWAGNSPELRFRFVAGETGKDATMAINMPDGSWLCNDDEFESDYNPGITIENPQAGQYDIWIGSYNEGEHITGTLYIADPTLFQIPEPQRVVEKKLDYSLEPGSGTFRLQQGFVPDPFSISARVGGEVAVEELGLGDNCKGFAAIAPDFRLNWSGTAENLRVLFRADQQGKDAVLIVNLSDGTWVCNDNANAGTLNPLILLNQPSEGQMDIWIAAKNQGEQITGTLFFTEKQINP